MAKKLLFFFIISLIIFISSSFVFAQTKKISIDCPENVKVKCDSPGFVPCGDVVDCSFDHIAVLIDRAIRFAMFNIGLPITAIIFIWAGFLIMTARGDTGQVSKGRKMLIAVAIGYLIAGSAWLVVRTIINFFF